VLVLVLGTIRPIYWQPLIAPPERDGSEDPHPQARELLTGACIQIPGTFTGSALGAGESPRRSIPGWLPPRRPRTGI